MVNEVDDSLLVALFIAKLKIAYKDEEIKT